jgi:hypothetical protein
MLDVKQFQEQIVNPFLSFIQRKVDAAAEELVLGTCIQESHLTYLKQIKGPALGVAQIEPATLFDLHKRYMFDRKELWIDFWNILGHTEAESEHEKTTDVETFYVTHLLNDNMLLSRCVSDLAFQVMTCRVKYLSIPEKLPEAGDLEGQAKYWSKYYNTHNDPKKEAQYMANYRKFAGE